MPETVQAFKYPGSAHQCQRAKVLLDLLQPRWRNRALPPRMAAFPVHPARPMKGAQIEAPAAFKCDGRTYCSQMTSCAEATFFLKNCPGAKMDGNHDGVPCEQQWCN